MTHQEILQTLAKHPFLEGLSETHMTMLADCAHLITMPTGEFLGREGWPADAFYLVQAGRVAIELHTPERGLVRIQTIGPGEIAGWSWLVPPYRWQFDAHVVEPVQAIALAGRCLRGKCDEHVDLSNQLLKRLVNVITARLMATRLQLLDLYK
jgi:CRP/FNR family transcriptional regulator, cyclic AMP receptor protein